MDFKTVHIVVNQVTALLYVTITPTETFSAAILGCKEMQKLHAG